MNGETAAAELHRLTRHGSPVDRSRLVDFRPLDPTNRPAPFKRYRGLETRALPRDFGTTGVPAVEVLSGRRPAQPAPLDEHGLARLLFFSAGVTRVSDSPAFEGRTYFRAAMSAGNLHPVELYVACGDLGAVPAGLYHFDPLEFGLTELRDQDLRLALAGAAGISEIQTAPCTIVLTGIPWRTAWKYGERGYRHLYWDAGTILANLLAVADAHGLAARVAVGFDDHGVAAGIAVDGTSEFPLALVPIGAGPPAPLGRAITPERIVFDVEPISPHPIEFPLITKAHAAGALADGVEEWREAAARLGAPARVELDSPGVASRPSIEDVILRRGSTRVMRRETAPRELLDWGMSVAARPVPGDFAAPGATMLEHYLSVHDVAGVEPGAYRWGDGTAHLVHRGDYRGEAQLLCLRQPLGGDSAYTAFHCADLDAVLAALGSRGYRSAQLEAGISAGRLTLAAFALGYGATGLTFFDEAVSHFFQARASCMLVTSVGVPAYTNAPGGPPGATTELGGYERLMERLSLQLHRAR